MVTKKTYIATLDIETKDGLKGSDFAIGGFYMPLKDTLELCADIEGGGNKRKLILTEPKEILITDTNKFRFFKRIFEVLEGKNVTVFIHNLDFDIRFVLEHLIHEMKINPIIVQSSSKILQVMLPDSNIVFRDSLQFLLCSQAEAEKTFLGKQIKEEVNFEKTLLDLKSSNRYIRDKAKELLKKRVITDVKGLLETIVTFRNLFNTAYMTNMFNYVTLPSFAVAIFRNYLKKVGLTLQSLNPYFMYSKKKGYYWINPTQKERYDWIRKSYFGGINEIYDMNYLTDVYYYDENSLYPSVCIENKFPNPKSYRTKKSTLSIPISKLELKEIREKEQLYIIEATVKENCKYPILPVRDKEDRIKFVNGIKKGIWCSPQFNLFLEKGGEIIAIHQITYYEESEYYLREYMLDSFKEKALKKSLGINSIVMIEKIKMNSLTGKFAQRYEKDIWTMPSKDQLQNKLDDYDKIDVMYFTDEYALMKHNLKTFKDFMIVEWTAFITSYSQAHMRKRQYLCDENGIHVYYTDTDCIFVDKPLEIIEAFQEHIGEGILQLKNELVSNTMEFNKEKGLYFDKQTKKYVEIPKFDEAKFYQPKVYATKRNGKIKVKAKGISTYMMYSTLNIPLRKDKETEKMFQEKVRDFSDGEELLVNGVMIDRFLKYRSALRRKQDLIAHEVIQKSMKKVYDKRRILPDLTTEPFNFEEIENSLKLCETQNLNTLKNNVSMRYVTSMEN